MEVEFTFVTQTTHGGKPVVSAEFSPSGKLIASSGSDRRVVLHNIQDGSLHDSFPEEDHLAGINQVGWLTDDLIVTAADDGLVRIKSLSENKLVRVFRLPNQSTPFCFTLHPLTSIITVGDVMGAVTSFHLHSDQVVHHFDAHGKGITAIQYSPDGRELITGSQDGIVRQWLPDPNPVCFQTIVPCPRVFTGISALAYSDDGRYIIVSTLDSTHRIFPRFLEPKEEQREAALLRTFKGHSNKKYSIPTTLLPSFIKQRHYLVSGSDKGQIHVWDWQSNDLLLSFPAHRGPVHSIAIRSVFESNDEGELDDEQDDADFEFMMVTAGRDGSVKLWTLRPRGDDTWQFRGPSLESTEQTMTEEDAKGEDEEDASEHRPAEAMDVDPDH